MAGTVAEAMAGYGIRVWLATDQVRAGEFYAREIFAAICRSRAVLLLASRFSVGDGTRGESGSEEVERELEIAKAERKLILPLAIDESLPDRRQAGGFRYQIALEQYIDCRTAVQCGQWSAPCRKIAADLLGQPVAPVRAGRQKLEDTARYLKEGRWRSAQRALPREGLGGRDLDRARLLALIAELQSQTLRHLRKAQADSMIASLDSLRDTEEAAAAIYLLGVLSRYYFEANALFDPTGGVLHLKDEARKMKAVSGKVLNMVRPMLPDGFKFELEWRGI